MIADRRSAAEQRADQQRELHVSHSHAAGVGERREEQESRQAERADRPLGRRMPDRLQHEDDGRGGQHDAVRDDPPLEVGGRHDDERGAGDRGRRRLSVNPNASTQPTRRQRGRELDGEVARRDPRAALAAAAASTTYETTGTLSYQRIGVSQLMHAEPGCTIERRSGTRAATTPRKLPMASPGTNTSGRTRSSLCYRHSGGGA